MDIITVSQMIRELRARLDNSDVFGVDVDFQMWTGGITAFRFGMACRETSDYNSVHHEFTRSLTEDELDELQPTGEFDGWWTELVADAHAWIDAIPSEDERKHNAFTAALGRLIDQGREVGIEVDFLNPLTAMMERLATNALEDKRLHK